MREYRKLGVALGIALVLAGGALGVYQTLTDPQRSKDPAISEQAGDQSDRLAGMKQGAKAYASERAAYLDHVSDLACAPASEGAILVSFILTNKGSDTARYELNFAVLDRTGANVASFGVAFSVMRGDLAPGGVGKYSSNHGMRSGARPDDGFTCQLIEVDRS